MRPLYGRPEYSETGITGLRKGDLGRGVLCGCREWELSWRSLKNVRNIAGCIKRVLGTDTSETVERHYQDIRSYRMKMVESKMRKEYKGEFIT